MSVVRESDELHRLVDRLTPGQARRLLALAKADPALAAAAAWAAAVATEAAAAGPENSPQPVRRSFGPMAEPGPEGDAIGRFRAFAGSVESGRGDLSEDHEEIIRDGLTAPRDHRR